METAQKTAAEFAARFLGDALPTLVGDSTKGVPVGAFCGHLDHVMTIRRALYEERSGKEKLLRKGGVVELPGDQFAVHLSVAGASLMGVGEWGAPVAPWSAVQELLNNNSIMWCPGLRLATARNLVMNDKECGSSQFTFCELFAGIGGFRLGLEASDGHCVFASEINKHAAATYKLNFGDSPFGDITECSEHDVPDHDLLTAGFPCQPFTNIGMNSGLQDLRGQLYREICRILLCKRPKAFLLENVKNIFNVGGGRGHAEFALREPGSAFLTILYALEVECGYIVHYTLISSEPWVPQSRERLYVVGFRPDLAHCAEDFRWPEPPKAVPGIVRDFLEEPSCPAVLASELTATQWVQLQNSKTFREKETSRIVKLDRPARTLVSSYKTGSAYYAEVLREERDGSKREVPRFFTARECCRAMGFPDDYRIPGDSLATKGAGFQQHQEFFHQIGNAVCPPVVTAIAVEILRCIKVQP